MPLKSKLSGNFQRLNAIDGSIEIPKNSRISKKFQLKWKVIRHFTRLKQRVALEKLFSLPPSNPRKIKCYYVFGTKSFLRRYTEICRHFLSKHFKNGVLECQEMVQCTFFLWLHAETCLCARKLVRKAFGCIAGAYYFQCQVSWGL